MDAADIMNRDIATVSPTATITDVARTLARHSLRGVPVCQPDGTLVGMIAGCDLIRPRACHQARPRHGWLHHLVDPRHFSERFFNQIDGDEIYARDLMRTDVVTASETTPVAEIVEMMMTRDLKRIPVVRDGKLVGIVTRADLVKSMPPPPIGLLRASA